MEIPSEEVSQEEILPEEMLPHSGLWTAIELQLLYEIAHYWRTGICDPENSMQMIIDWTSVAEDMNAKSRIYFVSHRDFTAEECCDVCISELTNRWQQVLASQRPWLEEETTLLRNGAAIVTRHRLEGRSECWTDLEPDFEPDFEELKIFMNEEGWRRGIRNRYYTLPSVKKAHHDLIKLAQELLKNKLRPLFEAGLSNALIFEILRDTLLPSIDTPPETLNAATPNTLSSDSEATEIIDYVQFTGLDPVSSPDSDSAFV